MKNITLSPRRWLLSALATIFLGAGASAQFVDFEIDPTSGSPWTPGTAVNTQYNQAPWHVSFSLSNQASPVVADYGGATQEAWGCGGLPDDTLSAFVPYDFGELFITDGNGVQRNPPALRIDYEPGFEPLRAGGFIHDIDGVTPTLLLEEWTIRAYDVDGAQTGPDVVLGIQLTTDGIVRDCDASYWEVVGDVPISRIVLRYTGHPNKQVGLGFDGFFPRLDASAEPGPCGAELCPRPTHWFPFDEGTPVNDAIAGPLTLGNEFGNAQPENNDGVDGSLYFNGDDAKRLEGGLLELLQRRGMTISMRLRPRIPAIGTRSDILFKGGYDFAAVGWGLYQGSGGKLNLTGHTADGLWTETSARILLDNEWVSVTLVITPCTGLVGQIQLYIDGILEASKTVEPFLDFDTYPLRIGTSDFQQGFYRGLMDELRFWNRPLSPCEVANLRMCSTPKVDCNANGISDSVELGIFPERDQWTLTSGGPGSAVHYERGPDGIPDECQGLGVAHVRQL